MNRKRSSRLEQAESIVEQCAEILTRIPVSALRRDVLWMPSNELLDLIDETLEHIHRYHKHHGN